MSLEKELFDDYKQKVKRRSFWRGVFFSILIFIISIFIFIFFSNNLSKPHIAYFEIKGIIFDDKERENLLYDLANDENVRAVILKVDSPGGTVVGAEILYHSIRNIAQKKPLVGKYTLEKTKMLIKKILFDMEEAQSYHEENVALPYIAPN